MSKSDISYRIILFLSVFFLFCAFAGPLAAQDSDSISAAAQSKPAISSFKINNGAANTTSQTVTLTIVATGNPAPTQYWASESASLGKPNWQTYSAGTPISFTLSSGNGPKTVYAWVKNSVGTSAFKSARILLNKPVPVVTYFKINGGTSATTTNRTVILNNSVSGNPAPASYAACETPSFPKTNTSCGWQPYSTAPSFTLSTGNGTKTVYFKVKNENGESAVVKSSIKLQVATSSIFSGSFVGDSEGLMALSSNGKSATVLIMHQDEDPDKSPAVIKYKGNTGNTGSINWSLPADNGQLKITGQISDTEANGSWQFVKTGKPTQGGSWHLDKVATAAIGPKFGSWKLTKNNQTNTGPLGIVADAEGNFTGMAGCSSATANNHCGGTFSGFLDPATGKMTFDPMPNSDISIDGTYNGQTASGNLYDITDGNKKVGSWSAADL